VVAFVLIATGLPLRSAFPTTSPPAPVSEVTARARVVTANIKVSISPRAAQRDLNYARRDADIVLAQEMWHRDAHKMSGRYWSAVQSGRPVPACRGNVVLWRTAVWRLARARAVLLGRSSLVNATRCVMVAVLVHRVTGQRLTVLSAHMLHHVEVAGRPRAAFPARVAFYARTMTVLDSLVTRIAAAGRRVLVGGDWNVDWIADHRVHWSGFPYAHLAADFDSNWGRLGLTRPTHGSRRIDTIWWDETRRIRPVSARTLPRTASDHAFVRVVLRIT
jgi:hypothetical protein